MSLHAEVDEDVCLSSGRCVADAPDMFEFGEDEIARTVDGGQAPDRARLLAVARACPSGAIRLTDGGVPVDLD